MDKNDWTLLETLTVGQARAEVTRDNRNGRMSYRISWTDGERTGAWFSANNLPLSHDIFDVSLAAEAYIMNTIEADLKEKQASLDAKKASEEAKRRKHQENVERRKEENRARANSAKSGKKG